MKKGIIRFIQFIISHFVYNVKYGPYKIKRKGGIGFLKPILQGITDEEAFLTSLDLKGKTIYDIGGYIGIMAVVFAKATGPAGKVIVFEPNKQNCTKILELIRINKLENIDLINLGIANKQSIETFIVSNDNAATGSFDEKIQSILITDKNFSKFQIAVDKLDNIFLVENLKKPDFIKIDVEGMEFLALLGMSDILKKYSPQLHIEIHGAGDLAKEENIYKIVKLLQSFGYSIWHIQSKQNITLNNFSMAKTGHIFCSIP